MTRAMPLMMMMMMVMRNEGDDTDDDDGADIDGEGDDSQVVHPAQNNKFGGKIPRNGSIAFEAKISNPS